ncbi:MULTISPECIES: ribosomal protection-like ABC-F family protein [Paenibacillus]|uniref:ribosomal protection-like ABC-F family protein n=1 Tax=Paenibacillus TaxID=44249 RepID=UPI0022B935F6|nr:ABC-F family ATP-binding cassette domain-containing protein [Paenibacillus caseinilyticus]MCZ8521165.1 ABC-F family ATP-binding cassette domain-containing protein [Paenibacillus caseinilyticus]
MSRIEAYGLKHGIGPRLLFGADALRIEDGDRIGIVGRNGTGKTTLLRILAGALEPDAGHVTRSGSVGVIPQFKEDGIGSGGEITSRVIDTVLAQDPDILFADEPTMNLDAERTEDLEERLRRVRGALVVISHDRVFLDRVCTKIWEIDGGRVSVYTGDYSAYERQKELEKRRHQERYEAYTEKRSALERAVRLKERKAAGSLKAPSRIGNSEARLGKDRRGSTQAGIHQARKALETRLAKLEKVEKPAELPEVKLTVPVPPSSKNRVVLEVQDLEASAGGRLLWSNVSLRLRFGEKAALLGPNGCGKTTLIRRIVGGGAGVRTAPGVKLGYFSQTLDILDLGRTVLENVRETSIHDDALARLVLARLLLRGDDVHKRTGDLSGGERVKTALAKLVLSDLNVLILDEPTNYLDTPSLEALEGLLAGYPGTVLFVSHDRRFVERTAGRILEIRDGGVSSFAGGYAEYREGRKGGAEAAPAPDDTANELLQVELRLAEVLGRLSMPGVEGAKELDAEFHRLIDRRRVLRGT